MKPVLISFAFAFATAVALPLDNTVFFTITENAAIAGHNKEHKTGTIEDCKDACLDKSWCKSFDYYKNSNACDLSDKNKYEVGGLKTNWDGNPYDYYEKIENGK